MSQRAFREAARAQRLCAVCGRGGAFHAHHIVDRSLLRREGQDEFDPRNALRLCPSCHFNHEFGGPGKVDVALAALSDEAIAFAFEALGAAASVFLERHYVGHDPRIGVHLERLAA